MCGDVGEAVGDSMYEGVIYVGGEIGSLGTDAIVETVPEGELIELWGLLERNGIEDKPDFARSFPRKNSTTSTSSNVWRCRRCNFPKRLPRGVGGAEG